MNILITGAKGQLGSELKYILNGSSNRCYFTDRDDLDITDINALDNFFEQNSIDCIINCAAYTAVDKAESEVESAYTLNAKAPLLLAQKAMEYNCKLIHISTDYVFDGKSYRPYTESDTVSPQSVYGKSKLEGEEAVLKLGVANTAIIRTSWLYSSYGANFVKSMIRLGSTKDELGVVFDQVGTPTYAYDLAKAVVDMVPQLSNTAPEIYHYSNEGVCSWYDFAKAIFEIEQISCKVTPITTNQYPTPATRPYYSVLNKQKIKEHFNIEIPYYKESLKSMLMKLRG